MSGRGGAGNILAVQQEKARVASDVEANLPPTVDSAAAAGSAAAGSAAAPTPIQDYAHSGRGGAGNYYSPKDLKETGRFSDRNPVVQASGAAQNHNHASPSPAPVARYGRGGAGNMSFGASESEEKAAADAERLKREKIEVETREAGESIAMPAKAKLPLPGKEQF